MSYPVFKDILATLKSWAPQLNRLSKAVEDIDLYEPGAGEKLTNKKWDGKPVYRNVIVFGSLPTATSFRFVEHGISGATLYISVKLIAKQPIGGFIQMNYAYPTVQEGLIITNIYAFVYAIVDMSSYTESYLILEYIK